MLNLGDSLVVGSPLHPFVLLVQARGGAEFVAGSIRIEDSHIKEGCVEVISPEPVSFTLSLAQSSLVAVLCNIASLLRGCRCGSTDTLRHT